MGIQRKFEIVNFEINGGKTNSIQELGRELLNDSGIEFHTTIDATEKCLEILELNDILKNQAWVGNSFLLLPKEGVDDKIAIAAMNKFNIRYLKYLEDISMQKEKREINERKKIAYGYIFAIGLIILMVIIIFLKD